MLQIIVWTATLIAAVIGGTWNGIRLWRWINRRWLAKRNQVEPRSEPAPPKSVQHEDRVLIRLDERQRDEAGTIEHLVYRLKGELSQKYLTDFVYNPHGIFRAAEFDRIMFQSYERICYFGIAATVSAWALALSLIAFFPSANTTSPLSYVFSTLATLLLVVPMVGVALKMRKKKASAKHDESLAQRYLDFMKANGIVVQPELTQLKSKADLAKAEPVAASVAASAP